MAEYYININGQQLGPFPANKLVSNGATADTMVWTPGMPSWELAKNVPELAPLFPAPSPPPGLSTALVSATGISAAVVPAAAITAVLSAAAAVSATPAVCLAGPPAVSQATPYARLQPGVGHHLPGALLYAPRYSLGHQGERCGPEVQSG